ncbi:MAG: hypothetical protein KKC18_05495, partial [Chloroflexi bacterium]|nr:hypothetical protein [Chloroflexota bacterium]
MPAIPPFVLKKLYVRGSLRAEENGFALDIENSIAPATIVAFTGLDLDGQAVSPAQVTVIPSGSEPCPMNEITAQSPLQFPVGATFTLRVKGRPLAPGPHEFVVRVVVQEAGPLDIP